MIEKLNWFSTEAITDYEPIRGAEVRREVPHAMRQAEELSAIQAPSAQRLLQQRPACSLPQKLKFQITRS